MTLPPIEFKDALVDAADITPDVWEQHFSNYLLRRGEFFPDIDRQQTLLDHFVGDIGLGVNALTMLAGLEGPDQHKAKCSTLRQWIALQKVDGVVSMLREALDDHPSKIVVYGVHKCMVHEVRERLRTYGALLLYEGTPDRKRRDMVAKFQTDSKYRVFVAQTAAIKPDVMLTAASEIVVAEASWKREENAAAILRVHNIRQARPVLARFVGLRGSVDARIVQFMKATCRRDVSSALGETRTNF